MIEVRELTKSYGNKIALNDISFTAEKGGVTGLLGRNGAGKTTTMNIVTGYISSDGGSVSIDGYDIMQKPLEAKRRVGYLPEQPPLYLEMTVEEYLRFASRLKGVEAREVNSRVDEALDTVNITDVRGRLIGNLSKGYRQRVGLAQALVGNPETVILDEPTVGLDPTQIIEVRQVIKRLGEERTVILSSHILKEIADICTHVVILSRGVKVADDSVSGLLNSFEGKSVYSVKILGGDGVTQKLEAVRGVNKATQLNYEEDGAVCFNVSADEDFDVRGGIFHAVVEARGTLLELKPAGLSLEEVFTRLTAGREGRA